MKIYLLLSVLSLSVAAGAQNIKVSEIKAYGSWKALLEGQLKDCENDARELSQPLPPEKTMKNTTIRNLRWLYIPSSLSNKLSLEGGVLSKFKSIDEAALKKVNEVLKKQESQAQSKVEAASDKDKVEYNLLLAKVKSQIQRQSGLASAKQLNFIPEDFLKKFDYLKACQCQNNSRAMASDEATYNEMKYVDFMAKEESHKVRCFVENATL